MHSSAGLVYLATFYGCPGLGVGDMSSDYYGLPFCGHPKPQALVLAFQMKISVRI